MRFIHQATNISCCPHREETKPHTFMPRVPQLMPKAKGHSFSSACLSRATWGGGVLSLFICHGLSGTRSLGDSTMSGPKDTGTTSYIPGSRCLFTAWTEPCGAAGVTLKSVPLTIRSSKMEPQIHWGWFKQLLS